LCAGTKVFEAALNAVKFLGWLKQFGPAQNNMGSAKGQGIYLSEPICLIHFNLRHPVWLRKLLSEQHHTATEAAGKNIGDTKFGRKWTRTRK
jgi:hypothetical protein